MNKEKLKWYLEQTKDWTLEPLHMGDWCKSFILRQYPDRTIMSTVIHFMKYPEQIILTGDVRPVHDGCMSDMGYGLDWFASKLDYDYLAEKFLNQRWNLDTAVEWWEWQLVELTSELERCKDELKDARDADPDEYVPEQPHFPFNKTKWLVCGEQIEGTICDAVRKFLEELKKGGSEIDAEWSALNAPAFNKCRPSWSANPDGTSWECYFDEAGSEGYGYVYNEVGWLYAIQHRFAETYPKVIEILKGDVP